MGQAFGFDPFERVVDYLIGQIERAEQGRAGGLAQGDAVGQAHFIGELFGLSA
jgi:hypothetical protein